MVIAVRGWGDVLLDTMFANCWELCSKVPKLGANTSGLNIGTWSPITGLMREQTHVSE